MTHRTLVALLIVLAAAVALSATSFPGSMIGFLFAISAVFFVGVPGSAIGKVLNQAGIPATEKDLIWVLAGFFALLVVVAAVQTWRQLRRRDLEEARSTALRLAVLLALPVMAWLSTASMVHSWR